MPEAVHIVLKTRHENAEAEACPRKLQYPRYTPQQLSDLSIKTPCVDFWSERHSAATAIPTPNMRIRKPFAGAFVGVCLVAALAGFSPSQYNIPTYKQSDKVLHFITFFLVTILFYWILETNRRRVLQLTCIVCPLSLGFGSEIIQSILPNSRDFDYYDILANITGSLLAMALCNWYHKRMLERKRAARSYHAVAGDDIDGVDVELGGDIGQQESGVIRPAGAQTVEEELDNWDENVEDWDDGEPTEESADGEGQETPSSSADIGLVDTMKRND